MTKLEVQQRVLQDGEPLSLYKFEWDEVNKVFSTTECCLVLDFEGVCGVTFKTGEFCTFYTGSHCTFETDSYCTFKTSFGCNFYTGYNCTFETGCSCTFKTGKSCVVVRRDIYEVIKLKENETIKLNEDRVSGYTVTSETEEMTMEEVCNELGRTIKIKK